jgi:hypothetical protein
LDALVNGAMKGETVLDDVLEDTFTRFCQFVYMGDYETPSFVPAPIDSSSGSGSSASSPTSAAIEPDQEVAEKKDDYDWGYTLNKRSKKEPPPPTMRQEFDDKVYGIELVSAARQKAFSRSEIQANQAGEDYTPVFLGHAHLYVFAEKWGIESLKALTLNKLHQTLVKFTIYESRCEDIVELVDFSYSNDNTPDLEDSLDDLRALVTQYVMCELESLLKAPEFVSLQEKQGLFSRDLLQMMRRRLN